MQPPEEKKGVSTSGTDPVTPVHPATRAVPETPPPSVDAESPHQQPALDDPYGHYQDVYGYDPGNQPGGATTVHTEAPASSSSSSSESLVPTVMPKTSSGGSRQTPPPPPPDEDEEGGGEDDGMLRMSFFEHLEELRSRLIWMLVGIGVSFGACLFFANELWDIVSAPAVEALKTIGANPPVLVFTSPTEAFSTIWFKMPLLVSLFVASPWVLYQVWAFIAPGLYKRERRFAVPFVVSTAGLFILGGCFAYFVAFRFGLTFLLGIGRDVHVHPMVSITEYFDLFVDVMLGIGLVFELPVIIFFLTLLRIASPSFLLANSRYAILLITILAAVVTPTPDIFNLMLFAVPMWMLFFIGVFAGYLLVLRREKRRFPWGIFFMILAALVLVVLGAEYVAIHFYKYHLIGHWPFITR